MWIYTISSTLLLNQLYPVDSLGTLAQSNSNKRVGNGNSSPKEYESPTGGGGITSTTKLNNQIVTFGHGGRHLEGTGLNVADVNQAIASEVSNMNYSVGKFYKGQVMVNGVTIEYTSYGVSEGVVNVGTYYPVD